MRQQAKFSVFLAAFAHFRGALAGGGGSDERWGWKLPNREAGSAPTQARKACREVNPS